MIRMDEELEIALAPVLADLSNVTSLTPEVRDSDWSGMQGVATAMIYFGRSGAGISINRGADRIHQVVSLADQIQECVVEALWSAGRSPVWPECPHHPDSHPALAVERDRAAIWVCPSSQVEICRIGSLPTR